MAPHISQNDFTARLHEVTERLQALTQQTPGSTSSAMQYPQSDSFARSSASTSAGGGQPSLSAGSDGQEMGNTEQIVSRLLELVSEVLPQLQASHGGSTGTQTDPSSSSSTSGQAQGGGAGGSATQSQPVSTAASNPTSASQPSSGSTSTQGASQNAGAGGASQNAGAGGASQSLDPSGTAGAATKPTGSGEEDMSSLDTLLSKLIDAIEALGAELSNGGSGRSSGSSSSNPSTGSNPSSSANTNSANANPNNAQSFSGNAGSGTSNVGSSGAAGSKISGPGTPPQVHGGSQSLAANKQQVWQMAKQSGATDQQAAALLAVGMLETNDLTAAQRDANKDGTHSANYSAFNMNKDMLQRLGWNPSTGPDLNDPANMRYAVGLAVRGMNTFGVDGFLAFNRGGSTGFADGSSYGVKDYQAAIQGTVKTLLADPDKITNAQRIASYVPYT